MSTPMAVLGMNPVQADKEEKTDPTTWRWKPRVKSMGRLFDVLKASQNTSRKTTSSQMDHGENK